MAAATLEDLNRRLSQTIQSMEQAGLVDSHFKIAYSLKEENGPFYFLQMVPNYCSDAQITLAEMTKRLEEAVVDYHQLDELCLKLKGGSSCLGAHRVAMTCSEFRGAAAAESKGRCFTMLNNIKLEFLALKEKLDLVIALETKIVCLEIKDA